MILVKILQIILCSLGILFIPGYLLTLIFFPRTEKRPKNLEELKSKKELDPIERILLSLALSMALVPLALFFLSLAGVKITQLSVMLSVGILIIIEVFYLCAKYYLEKPKK